MPLLIGFMVTGPVSGWLSDRFGARAFATGGMLITALGFVLLTLLPGDFNQWVFFALLLLMGGGMGLFAAPNTTSIMNAVPRRGPRRGLRYARHLPERRPDGQHRLLLQRADGGAGRAACPA